MKILKILQMMKILDIVYGQVKGGMIGNIGNQSKDYCNSLNLIATEQDKINNILEKIIYVYFGISSDQYFIDFEECDTQKSDNDLSIRIERFKFLILALMTNDVDLIKNKSFEYSPDKTKPQKKKTEKLDRSNYTKTNHS